MNHECTIQQVPLKTLVSEAVSRKERMVKEVMDHLYASLPEKFSGNDFILSDGTECWIKKFHPPRKDEEDGYIYGFDVKFAENSPLVHLEFSVRCSGWEKAF